MEADLNGPAAPPYNNGSSQHEQPAIAASSSRPIHHHGDATNEPTMPPNHLAVIQLRTWDPATPQSTHAVVTCTANVSYDDGMLATTSRKQMNKKLSLISEGDEEAFFEEETMLLEDTVDDSFRSTEQQHDHHHVQLSLSPIATAAAKVNGGSTTASLDIRVKDGNEGNTVCAGSYIGIHLQQQQPPSSMSSSSHQITWNVDDTISIQHKINLIPHTDLQRIIHLMENNHSSVQTLILDGLSPSTFTTERAQAFAIALGERNTTVQNLSIRNSHVNDTIANLLALALVQNTTLERFSLEGNNELTSVAAKNFFGAIQRRDGNTTLRYLNLRNNPMVDGELLEAMDQFMEQRELRRRLLLGNRDNKKRGRSGLNNDVVVNDEPKFDSVTVVCHETILDGTFDADTISLETSAEIPELKVDMTPLENESFMHYMQRMNPTTTQQKTSMRAMAATVLASQRLHAQSRRQVVDMERGGSNHMDSTLPSSRESSFTSRSSGPFRKNSSSSSTADDKKKHKYESNGQVGIHQINEAAPGRQRRSSARRSRSRMTESQRLARLSALTDGAGISSKSATTFGRNSTRTIMRNEDEYMHMQSSMMNTLESMGDESYHDNELDRRRQKSMFGLDDPELRVDCFACSCIIVLLVVMMIMVVVYLFL